jgi:hypothetical protein
MSYTAAQYISAGSDALASLVMSGLAQDEPGNDGRGYEAVPGQFANLAPYQGSRSNIVAVSIRLSGIASLSACHAGGAISKGLTQSVRTLISSII